MQQPGRGTQLPSIRSLHPYLPPPPPSATSLPAPSSHPSPSPSDRDARDSSCEHESATAAGDAPKKKRRRQALSCTECKRRKIRCDRTQPCTPCVRRGDQDKCKWHVVEPVAERYVALAEHEALRTRVGALEAFISHLPSGVLASMPPVPSPPPRHQPSPYFITSQSPTQAYPPHAFHSPVLDVRSPPPGPPPRKQSQSQQPTWAPHRGGSDPREHAHALSSSHPRLTR
ncbi:hypothetical protein FB45DRAFT_927157 [Roridomyces roridus]|uniref:Zn(2)-C6 fungal-type domain-containing protein n=1 Tax=Roridomyces roridus TaxID=1738132 RepID=A0AAD7BJ12_9AGAR|nr:hypothetical protein FB45DRAFT_927157 [Roridomyces roridus]